MDGPQPAGVAIVGMHRSGTSAVAGFLAQAGYFAGKDDELLPPQEDNPKGYFEREDVNALNDELFASLGGAWERPPSRQQIAEAAPAWTGRIEGLLDGLRAGAAGRPLVLKDPRVSLALPAWTPAVGESLCWLVVERNPVDTALSLRKRDGRPLSVALALWQLYSTELLEGLAGRRVLVVHYDDFVRQPAQGGAALLERLGEVLAPGMAATLEPARAKGFVSGSMRHHSTDLAGPIAAETMTCLQMDLARWLAALPTGWAELEPPAELRQQPESALVATAEYYDAMGDRHGIETAYDTERHRALHFEQATELKDRHIANIEAALEAAAKRAESDEERVGQLEAEVRRLEEDNTALREELRRLREDGLAAASNLFTLAKRSLSGRAGGSFL
ncbi:MAG: hypothetical protein M0005_00060 [Actinomycetota bacterium]|jgi:hypothetical protein|nr:hypothetical protein [Actinomycetota bacterium]